MFSPAAVPGVVNRLRRLMAMTVLGAARCGPLLCDRRRRGQRRQDRKRKLPRLNSELPYHMEVLSLLGLRQNQERRAFLFRTTGPTGSMDV